MKQAIVLYKHNMSLLHFPQIVPLSTWSRRFVLTMVMYLCEGNKKNILLTTDWKETYQYIHASIINLWSVCPLDTTSFLD